MNDAGERPVAAAGSAERSNDGAVGRRLGVPAAQSVSFSFALFYVIM